MKKYLIIIFLMVLAVFGVASAMFQLSKSRTFQFFGGLTERIETERKVVALTFDDAPTEQTKEVLRILEDNDVKATFYAIGRNIEKYPDIAKAIVEQGHEIGNHSYSHNRFLLKSQGFIKNEIEWTNELIRDTGYAKEITFRPPNGKKLFGLPWYLKRKGIKTIMWDVEPDTYVSGKDAIVEYALNNVKPGSIILMHPFCEASCADDREALSAIISGLKADGYIFLSVSELLKYHKPL